MNLSKLQVSIGVDLTQMQQGLAQAQRSLQEFGKKMTATGAIMSKALTAPIVTGFGFAVKAASDAEETFSKFATIFRDVETEAEQAFQTLRHEYGLSSKASKELLGNTGDLLTGFGFAQTEALRLSTEVNKLAVDLASFTNFSGGAEGASQALTKALLGERESVKSLGISILEEDVKKQMAINTSKGLTFATERQAKAQATLDIAISQSQNAIGDYARTQDSFANQMRLLQARTNDLAVEFGQILMPVARRLLGVVSDLVSQFQSLDTQSKQNIVTMGLLVAAIGPVLLIVGKLALAVNLLLTPLYLKIAVIALLAVAFLELAFTIDKAIADIVFKVKQFQFAVLTLAKEILEKMRPVAIFFGVGMPAAIELGVKAINDSIDSIDFTKPESESRGFIERLGDGFDSLVAKIQGMIFGLEGIGTAASNATAQVERALTDNSLIQAVDSMSVRFERTGTKMRQSFEQVKRPIAELPDAMTNAFEVISPIVDNFVASFGAGMANVVVQAESLIDALKNIGKLLLSSVIQRGLQLLLSGGLSTAGTGFFGSGRGLIGSITGALGITKVGDALIQSNGNIVKFHPDDNILAMKDFGNLSGSMASSGGGTVRVRLEPTTVRVSNRDITFAFVQGQTQWER
jgi:hypothetical protein